MNDVTASVHVSIGLDEAKRAMQLTKERGSVCFCGGHCGDSLPTITIDEHIPWNLREG